MRLKDNFVFFIHLCIVLYIAVLLDKVASASYFCLHADLNFTNKIDIIAVLLFLPLMRLKKGFISVNAFSYFKLEPM